MGDRANIKVVDGKSTVYLYTHNEGTDLPKTLQAALGRSEDRWSDGQYLARIIFSEMIHDDVDGTTGYGISSVVGDGGDRIITVDVDKQLIIFSTHKDKSSSSFMHYAHHAVNPSW